MTEHEASRTLVKSPPELWAECSDAGSLARHLEEFGEIRITRLEPETDVAWEGERASGTVRIEPSAWGTRVTLTARTTVEEPVAVEEEPVVVAEEPVAAAEEPQPECAPEEPAESVPPPAQAETVAEPGPAATDPRRGRFRTRIRGWFKPAPPAVADAEPVEALAVEPTEAELPPPVEPPRPDPIVLAAEPDPEPEAEPEPEPGAAEAPPAVDPEAVLTGALDSLGQAHHRPFSRA